MDLSGQYVLYLFLWKNFVSLKSSVTWKFERIYSCNVFWEEEILLLNIYF